MKLIRCPLNGLRNASEFACLGEVRTAPGESDQQSWADHVWNRGNAAGMVREWWCHLPSTYWFVAERNTLTDEIVATYPAADLPDGIAGR